MPFRELVSSVLIPPPPRRGLWERRSDPVFAGPDPGNVTENREHDQRYASRSCPSSCHMDLKPYKGIYPAVNTSQSTVCR